MENKFALLSILVQENLKINSNECQITEFLAFIQYRWCFVEMYKHLYIKHRSFCSYISHSHLKSFYQFATYWLYEIVLAQSIYHDGNFTEIILKQHLSLTTMSQIISISLLVTLCIVNKKNIDCKMKTQLSINILWISERNYIRILCNFAQHDEKKQHILSVN